MLHSNVFSNGKWVYVSDFAKTLDLLKNVLYRLVVSVIFCQLTRASLQTGDQGELHGRACVRKNRIEGRVSVHSSTPLFLPKSKHTHNNNNNKLPKDWLIA